uniref:Uncharacterized protein n=1 Tax=Anguilla anguilla TaxID=7936 RepID=A0A0E9SE71_ANGAN
MFRSVKFRGEIVSGEVTKLTKK